MLFRSGTIDIKQTNEGFAWHFYAKQHGMMSLFITITDEEYVIIDIEDGKSRESWISSTME